MITKSCGILFKLKWFVLILSLAIFQFGSAGYIYAKAEVAQWLIEDAWLESIQQNKPIRPWQWADTYPVAKLSFLDQELFVLAGATGRVLAFGPGHITHTAEPGAPGNTAIAGHRDTHFAKLEDIKLGELIGIQTAAGVKHYAVVETRIAHQDQVELLEQTEQHLLTLITCYPFNSISPNTDLRYIVRAQAKITHNQEPDTYGFASVKFNF